MTERDIIKMYDDQKIRTLWDADKEKWFISIIDVFAVLTEQEDLQKARKYWNKLKERLNNEGNQTVTNCHQLKLRAADGKMRKTDVADTEQLFRLIQSVPSPKAEPFKMWLAQVASERIEELQDPEMGNGEFWSSTSSWGPSPLFQLSHLRSR